MCVCVYKCANGKVNHHRGGAAAAAAAAALMIKSWQCEHYHWKSMNKQIHDAWPAKRAERSRGTIGKRREKELWIKEISELICTCCRPVAAAAAARTFALPLLQSRTVINRPELWSLKLNGVLKQTQAHKQAHRIRSSFVVNSTGKTNCHRCVQSVELCGNCWLAFAAAAAAAMKVQYDWSLESVLLYTQANSRAQSAELKLRRLFHNTTNHRLEPAAVTVFRLIVEHTVSALFDYISV